MGGDTNAELLRGVYDGYEDWTGQAVSAPSRVHPTPTVTLTQATYDAMVAAGTVDPQVTYVITPTHATAEA